mmetsp:Transcript_29254/g.51192  ORF Transcript_29254/g.51192 Transcript_29254/m.51192 type:complete len:220 (-) Transcript_29254:660-1319(-)
MYATCAVPQNGSKWCSHSELNCMSRTATKSCAPSTSKMPSPTALKGSSSAMPLVSSSHALAARAGVFTSSGRPASLSPSVSIRLRKAASATALGSFAIEASDLLTLIIACGIAAVGTGGEVAAADAGVTAWPPALGSADDAETPQHQQVPVQNLARARALGMRKRLRMPGAGAGAGAAWLLPSRSAVSTSSADVRQGLGGRAAALRSVAPAKASGEEPS